MAQADNQADFEVVVRVTHTRAGFTALVALAGEVDLYTAPIVRGQLESLTGMPVTVDLADLAFMDMSGLRVLLEARLARQRAGSDFRLENPGPRFLRLLRAAAVSGVFEAALDPQAEPGRHFHPPCDR